MNLSQAVKHQLHDLKNIENHAQPALDWDTDYDYQVEGITGEEVEKRKIGHRRSRRDGFKLFDDPETLI